MNRHLPRGRVTFAFTDVEGSTRLLHAMGAAAYAAELSAHRDIVRLACEAEGGVEVDTQGDAFFLAFAEPAAAARAALSITQQLAHGPIRLRIGLHTGSPLVTDDGYIGEDVHLGARIGASAHGGQIVCSLATRDAVSGAVELLDLGEHRLKDIEHAVAIYQLGPGEFPPLRTISNTNLPRPADAFLGREREMASIEGLIGSGRRLVSLIGPGGTGKTRLAIEAAAALVGEFKAGVFWVDLSSVRDVGGVLPAIAASLGATDDLEAFIGERELLLVIDNVEQVVGSAPQIGALVSACPNLAVIATSRERLRIRGESVFQVPPLDRDDASRLFVDRAGLVRSADLDAVCERLEFLPLAIELAAARSRALTPRQILDRLGSRLDLLEGGRDADPRQRTLRATIDWSHDLLSADEQRLVRRFSVVAGGASLDAVEAVCDADLDTLASVIDKSLVRHADARYTMLETIREYAAERLEAAGEHEEFRRRHAAWVTGLMATHVPRLESNGGAELARSLSQEFANVRVAFAGLVAAGDAAGAARLIDVTARLIGPHLSQSRVGLAMCESALQMPGVADADRARVRHREGSFAMWLSDRTRARVAWTDAAELARRAGDAVREGHVLHNLALIAVDAREASALMERSVELLSGGSDEQALAMARWNLVGLKVQSGEADPHEAESITLEVLAWAMRANDYRLMSQGELEMGEFALQRGDPAEALARGERLVELAAPRGHTVMELLAQGLRARASARLGRRSDAVTALDAVMDLLASADDLEADDEIVEIALSSAGEVFGAVGEVALAGRMEQPRREIARRIAKLSGYERTHADWLAHVGVVMPPGPAEVSAASALAMAREWLASNDREALRAGESH